MDVYLLGFSQPIGNEANVAIGAAPLQAERPPSIAEPQHATPTLGLDAPKDYSPMLPEPQVPRSSEDLLEGETLINSQASLSKWSCSSPPLLS